MQAWTIIRTAALTAPLMVAAAAMAQDEEPAARAPRSPLAQEVLSPTTTLTAWEIVMAPGQVSNPHSHSGSVFVYVLAGEVRSQINDEPAVVYKVGESWFEPEGVVHTLAENMSDTDEVRLLAVAIAAPGAPFSKAPTH